MQKVVVIVEDGAEPYGLGSMCEVFAEPYHPEDENPVFDFKVCTPRPGRVRGASGFDLHVEHVLGAPGNSPATLVRTHTGRAFLTDVVTPDDAPDHGDTQV